MKSIPYQKVEDKALTFLIYSLLWHLIYERLVNSNKICILCHCKMKISQFTVLSKKIQERGKLSEQKAVY